MAILALCSILAEINVVGAREYGMHAILFLNTAQAIADIETALSSGALQHRIAHTLPLENIAEANEIIEQGSIRGAVVLNLD